MIERMIVTERETLKFRLLALLMAAGGLFLSQKSVPLFPAIVLVVSYLVYALLLHQVVLPRLRWAYIMYGMVVVDVAAVSTALYLVGVASPVFILLPFLIIYYAIYMGYISGIIAAMVATLGYTGAAMATGVAELVGSIITTQVPLFFLLALFTGYLAQARFREQEEKEALQEVLQVERGARTILEATKRMGHSLDVNVALERILHDALRVTGLASGVLAMREGEDGPLVGRVTNIALDELGLKRPEELVEKPGRDSLALRALKSGLPQVCPKDLAEVSIPSWLRMLSADICMVIPLIFDGKQLGVIHLWDKGGKDFNPKDLDLAQGFGDMAAMVLANALAYQEAGRQVGLVVEDIHKVVRKTERLKEMQRREIVTVDGLRINAEKGTVTQDGKPVTLSRTEFDLLYMLASRAGTAVGSEILLHSVWGDDYVGQSNIVDVSIHRLRKKIEVNPAAPRRIVTVRGVGYMMAVSKK
ncbi:MAG: winged helix-turn-helix domain-containing protein [Chloroflexi bacterium]|nr:winged helix-turn-helix domain-containing protein [Chloroflexota bacterium]